MEAVSTAARRRIGVRWLGRIAYAEALELQREAAECAAGGGEETLLLLEHDPVFTLGRNATEDDVLWGAERRREAAVELHGSDRGGRATYHGPGQLVGYPILNLAPDRKDVRRYVRDLEEVVIRTLSDFGIRGERSSRRERVTSVWVGNDKIAAIGVHIARWVTTHGFALNVTDESLPHFSGIVPCGITDGGVTSIERVSGKAKRLEEVVSRLVPRFEQVFGRAAVPSAAPVPGG